MIGHKKITIFISLIFLKFLTGSTEKLKKHKHLHAKKRNTNDKDSNTMLMFDSSNGFQRAIQNDIEDLNNPVTNLDNKRAEIPLTSSQPAQTLPIDNSSQATVQELIIDQIRYVAAIEREKQRYACLISPQNCSDESLKEKQPIIPQVAPQALTSESQSFQPLYSLIQSPQVQNYTSHDLQTSKPQEDSQGLFNSSTTVVQYTSQPPVIVQPQIPDQNQTLASQTQTADLQKGPASATTAPSDSTVYQAPTLYCTSWSDWGKCSDTCKNGFQMRYRECFDVKDKKIEKEWKPCSNPDCDHCTEWSPFSSCTKMCGTGNKTKSRTCYMKNGQQFQDFDVESCNFHPCQPDCEKWGEWSDCSKPCGAGVTIRNRTCTLADHSQKTFYEHKACNNQACTRSDITTPSTGVLSHADEDKCLSAHLSFESFRYNTLTIYDNTHEHNDAHYSNMILFNGNLSCGYSGALTGKKSFIHLYDDLFIYFDEEKFSVAMWVYPIKTILVEGKMQTLFTFNSVDYDKGKYKMVLNDKYQPTFYFLGKESFMTATTDVAIEIDSWQHIYVFFDGPGQKISFYINGKEIALTLTKASAVDGAQAKMFSDKKCQSIGNEEDLSTPFSGVVDEIYLLKCQLPVDIIRNVANACQIREGKYCPTPSHGICSEKLPFTGLLETPVNSTSGVEVTPLNTFPF